MIDKRLTKEIPEAKQYIVKQVFMLWIVMLSNVGFVIMIASFLDRLAKKDVMVENFYLLTLLVILLLLIRVFCTKKAYAYSYLASCEVKDTLRSRLYSKLLTLKNDYHESVPTSELVQLSVEGIDQLEIYFGRYLPQFFYSMLAPITLFLILVWMDLKSALVLLLCVPLIPVSIILIQKIAKKLLSKYWTSYAGLGDSFLENLQGLTTLKIYQADEFKNMEMNKEAEHFRKITMKVLTMQLNSVSVMDLIAYGGSVFGSIIAITGYMNGSVSLFAVICIVLLSAEFFIPLRMLGSYFHIAMNGIAANAKIFKILDIDVKEHQHKKLDKEKISIRFEHLSFSYDQSREIIHDVSFEIKANQFIGIVGESGSGKSTCAKLITGLMKQYSGHLLIQGKDRKDIDDTSFYERFMYVTHKPMIFKGSVRDNLLIGKKDASDDELYQALKSVQLYDFIASQEGLDTKLLENGTNFSGGQNQRLYIARALLKDSEVYIFDEATSNIDVESETAILAVIQSLSKQKTVIMITHRLTNIVTSDQIYVMQNGCLVEKGTHTSLLKQDCYYAMLFNKQQELETYNGGYYNE